MLIEIAIAGVPVKYEVDKSPGALLVDWFPLPAMYYTCNYGLLLHTLAEAGDPLDVLVAGRNHVILGAFLLIRPKETLKLSFKFNLTT